MAEHAGDPVSQDPGQEAQGRPIVLTQPGADTGTLRVNHRWDIMPADPKAGRPSVWRRLFPPMQIEVDQHVFQPMIDLDLGCFYELTNGARGVVQAKGNQRGDFNRPPYITHGSDDRYGSAAGENLFVNLDYANRIRRILIYVYRYPLVIGTSSDLSPARGTVTFYPTVGPPVEVELGFSAPDTRTCAVALITHATNGRLVARRDLRYVGGYHDALDALYNWDLQPGAHQFPTP
ncbi:MAG TPA: hypothetical protein VHX59_06250 [Mycobacteriales bacterium]|jgi:tellurite resistance protein TerA|nr:hypothetical protein [Mycobacteriales bacterium]